MTSIERMNIPVIGKVNGQIHDIDGILFEIKKIGYDEFNIEFFLPNTGTFYTGRYSITASEVLNLMIEKQDL